MTYDPNRGIRKCNTREDLNSITDASQDDFIVTQDSGTIFQYRDGEWTSAFNTFSDPSTSSNWVLVESKKFDNVIPSGSFDISGCNKFMLEISVTSSSGPNYIQFGNDTSNTLSTQTLTSQGSVSSSTLESKAGFIISGNSYPIFSNTIFDKTTKCGIREYAFSTALQMVNYKYTGTDSMDSLVFNGSYAITGTINIYKWQEVKPVELASYELLKKYSYTASTINEVLPIDSSIEDIHIVTKLLCTNSITGGQVVLRPNNDSTSTNYYGGYTQQSGTTVNASRESSTGFSLGVNSLNMAMLCRANFSNVSINGYHLFNHTISYGAASQTSGGYSVLGSWKGSEINSLQFYSTCSYTGTIEVYKLAKSHLISTNPNLLTTWIKSIDSDTIQIQPGEIEINGIICQVPKSTNITLSGNLRSGLTESANTYYYLYAVKNSSRTPSYIFDTVPPTMDRYGQTVSSFADCDFSKAWFHPSLGLNYRFIGQVYNNSSSNILLFDKMKPGYWEGVWTSLPATGSYTGLPHGFCKIPTGKTLNLLGSTTATSTGAKTIPNIYYLSTNGFGAFIDNNISSTDVLLYVYFGSSGIFYNNSSWVTSGYYKLIIKD